MAKNQLLKFISDEELEKAIKKVLHIVATDKENAAKALHKNKVDPFSALFDASHQKISELNLPKTISRLDSKQKSRSKRDFCAST